MAPLEAQIVATQEFRNIQAEEQERLTHSYRNSASSYSVNAAIDIEERSRHPKNRYSDIFPYDHTRVRLAGQQDYINASVIDTGCRKWIATQGPLTSTMHDFWQMVEEHSGVVVMLCRIIEAGRAKCAQYWPTQTSTKQIIHDETMASSYEIVCNDTSFNPRSNATYTKLQLTYQDSQQAARRKRVDHIHYANWPDHGTASMKELLVLLDTIAEMASPDEPIVIHCSAGCGRTGTLMALDALRQDPKQDLAKLVRHIREQRMACVQTLSQYLFLSHCRDVLAKTADTAGGRS